MNSPLELVIPFITRSLVPGLLIVVCSVELLPNTTFPNDKLAGLILNPAATPVPCTEYTVGDPDALCVIVSVPANNPVTVGVNVTSNI